MATKQQFLSNSNIRKLAAELLAAYKASWSTALSPEDFPAMLKAGGVMSPTGQFGIIFTPELTAMISQFVIDVARALGPRAGHERTIRTLTLKEAQAFAQLGEDVDAAVKKLLEGLYEHNNDTFEYFDANHLIKLETGLRSLRLGTVRAMLSMDYMSEVKSRRKDESPIKFEIGPTFGFKVETFTFTVSELCWVVELQGAYDHAEEEAKWLIDVMVSFLRCQYTQAPVLFPRPGEVEPHPIRPDGFTSAGILFTDASPRMPVWTTPPHYAVNAALSEFVHTEAVQRTAALLCNPPAGSLAERVSRGLGWLTRGRQAKDRSERLLHFFTAIEALLSSESKSDPVVDTIARYSGVILTEESRPRWEVAAELRALYEYRSDLVHRGDRAILENSVNKAQWFAELLFLLVLKKADLSSKYMEFAKELREASYGRPWSPRKEASE